MGPCRTTPFLARDGRSPGGGAQLLAMHHTAVGRSHAASVWGVVAGAAHKLYLYSEHAGWLIRSLPGAAVDMVEACRQPKDYRIFTGNLE